jgi:hypothetical protein
VFLKAHFYQKFSFYLLKQSIVRQSNHKFELVCLFPVEQQPEQVGSRIRCNKALVKYFRRYRYISILWKAQNLLVNFFLVV